MIWRVQRFWDGETAFILAGGSSLRGQDLSGLAGRKVLTVNDSWRLAPHGSINYFGDGSWWTDQIAKCRWSLDATRSFHDQIYKGFWVTAAPGFQEHPQVMQLRLTGERGLETEPDGLRHGSNSGYQAINLCYHLGARRIVLLGYDMRCYGYQTHWHDDAKQGMEFEQTLKLSFLPHFESLVTPLAREEVDVVNATPNSSLTCWPFVPLEKILEKTLSIITHA